MRNQSQQSGSEEPKPSKLGKHNFKSTSWKTALYILGSSLLGGVAVAIWDRRALNKIRAYKPNGDTARKDDGLY